MKQNLKLNLNSKERKKRQRGITLVALVVTIVVLLILAGITIITLTGENGIIATAQNAKKQNTKAELKEQIERAVINSRLSILSDANMDLAKLEVNLLKINGLNIESKGEDGNLPWIVTVNGYKFKINENGTVEAVEGITLSKTTLRLITGESETITAILTEGTTGTITWESSDDSKVTVNNGVVTAVGNSGTATIKAKVEGASFDPASCNVTIVQKVTSIIVTPSTVEIEQGGTKSLNVTTEPSGTDIEDIEDLEYITSDTTGKITVNEEGKVAVAKDATVGGTATITVKGKKSGITGTCSITVKKGLIKVTGEQIVGHEKEYYGKEVLNYKLSESDTNTYRIFYVSSTANEFGDPQYTIYLKADDSMAYKNIKYNLNDYASYDSENTKVREMNPDWANGATSSTNTTTRGDSESSWKIKEKAAAYLCSPVNETNYETTELPWKEYYNQEAANYVIGSPSVEMYVKSYNQAYNEIITDNTKYPLGANYRVVSHPGYIYKINNAQSTISNSDYFTGDNTLDYTRYNSMYCGKTTNGIGSKGEYHWWLASPSAGESEYYSNNVCRVGSYYAGLNSSNYRATYGICPLVSLKSGFQVQIEP